MLACICLAHTSYKQSGSQCLPLRLHFYKLCAILRMHAIPTATHNEPHACTSACFSLVGLFGATHNAYWGCLQSCYSIEKYYEVATVKPCVIRLLCNPEFSVNRRVFGVLLLKIAYIMVLDNLTTSIIQHTSSSPLYVGLHRLYCMQYVGMAVDLERPSMTFIVSCLSCCAC